MLKSEVWFVLQSEKKISKAYGGFKNSFQLKLWLMLRHISKAGPRQPKLHCQRGQTLYRWLQNPKWTLWKTTMRCKQNKNWLEGGRATKHRGYMIRSSRRIADLLSSMRLKSRNGKSSRSFAPNNTNGCCVGNQFRYIILLLHSAPTVQSYQVWTRPSTSSFRCSPVALAILSNAKNTSMGACLPCWWGVER